jgi:hypothetical protein
MNNIINKLKQYIPDSSFVFVTGLVTFFYFIIALLHYCGEPTATSIFWVPIVIHAIHLFWLGLATSVAIDDKLIKDIKLLNNIGSANVLFLFIFISWIAFVKLNNPVISLFLLIAGLSTLATIRALIKLHINNDKRGH